MLTRWCCCPIKSTLFEYRRIRDELKAWLTDGIKADNNTNSKRYNTTQNTRYYRTTSSISWTTHLVLLKIFYFQVKIKNLYVIQYLLFKHDTDKRGSFEFVFLSSKIDWQDYYSANFILRRSTSIKYLIIIVDLTLPWPISTGYLWTQ